MSSRHVTNKHHRKPRSKGGDDSSRNVIVVDYEEHKAWHLLFRNLHPEMIVAIINDVWIDPEYKLILRNRKRPTK